MNRFFKTSSLYNVLIVLPLCIFSNAPTLFGQPMESSTIKRLQVGDEAPDILLQDFSGKTFHLSEQSKKNGIVLWFTNLCGGCQAKMLKMQKLTNQFDKKGVEIVAVSQLGEDKETVEQTIREKKLTFRFLYDPKG